MARPKSPDSTASHALATYREKRNPLRTTEPFEPERAVSPDDETWAGRFVVHQHAATRMHWDLRIQIGTNLLSFAVPRGPSLNPADKRLAVHTENHPLAYLDFEDVIPEGNYGAGAMIIWDSGGVRYLETSAEQGIARGKIDFWLSGFKLQGRFGLILTKKAKAPQAGQLSRLPEPRNQEWLLVKKPDAHARPDEDLVTRLPRSVLSGLTVSELADPAPLVASVLAQADARGATPLLWQEAKCAEAPPMVCALEGAPLHSADWLYELKLDGVRILATKGAEATRLRYRSGLAATSNYPEIARAVRALPFEDLVLDGEIVTFDDRGRPHFGLLAPRIAARKAADVTRVSREVPVVFLCFDILALDGRDLRHLPLTERKALLAEVVRGQGLVRALDHIDTRGDALFSLCEQEELEGIVAKRKSSSYLHGPSLSGDWVKIKRARDEEFVVVGTAPGRGTRRGLGALALGSYAGDSLIYRGRVGSGFTDELLKACELRLADLKSPDCPASGVPKAERTKLTWVHPELVVRVKFSGFTNDGHLRAPVLLGLCDDRDPRQCRAAPSEERMTHVHEEQPVPGEPHAAAPHPASHPSRLVLTNKEKIFWPDQGYTKGDLIDYYDQVAPVMLPFLRGRPVVLVRYPDGIAGKSFYQWRAPEGTPDWIRTTELYDEEKQAARGTGKSAFLLDSRDALLHVVNLGCIPLHVLASIEQSPLCCDFLTIDLDLGTRPFRDAVLLSLTLRDLLEELGLTGFPKTSGQRGLHVLVPLGPRTSFETAKILCELLGRLLVGRHPALATMERRKDKRGDRVYIDTGQTGRSRTIVAPYSARAFDGATVSTPLTWEEIHLALDPSTFTIESVPLRLSGREDPMAALLGTRPDLEQAIEKLSRWATLTPS